ncbi:uncharacterized protein DNG_08289 [Cephalotrichum gorgonifer]|uniref:Uncharacterized protein n=1 Tax=Cephalotrichum gorgonifer TaxID=2041049 RepID=A0AAE8N418_9PEZI|nr:uncharacterized protein DNG_08289 [Cephalotrichum gorgonifer]
MADWALLSRLETVTMKAAMTVFRPVGNDDVESAGLQAKSLLALQMVVSNIELWSMLPPPTPQEKVHWASRLVSLILRPEEMLACQELSALVRAVPDPTRVRG